MTIENAIRHCIEVAEGCTVRECAEDHRQLADWLRDYKRLLAKESGNLRCRTCVHFEDDEADECGRCFEYSAWKGGRDDSYQ